MTNVEIIRNVRQWNANPRVHRLFCRNDQSHPALTAVEHDGAVQLVCRACDYREPVPQLLLHAWIHAPQSP